MRKYNLKLGGKINKLKNYHRNSINKKDKRKHIRNKLREAIKL
jgi:hypothetical protein